MPHKDNSLSRRSIIKGIGGGFLGAALGANLIRPIRTRAETSGTATVYGRRKPTFSRLTTPARVSLIKGNDRREIVYKALKGIEDEVLGSIGGKRILIKPNFVSTSKELCATHVDAVRGILDFLQPHYKKQIIVGESTASKAGTFDGYKNYGYQALENEYNVKLVDLNRESWQWGYAIGKGNQPVPVRLISTFYDPDLYIISAAKMKTHDRVVTTLSLKNILMAAPLNDYKRSDKGRMHNDREHAYARDIQLHYNMFHLAQQIYPNLGVIDGFVGMEGDGPVSGTPVDARVALASLDPLALDVLTTRLMGFDPSQIMYLTSLAEVGIGQGDLTKIQVIGTPAEHCQYHFKASRHMIEPYGLG